MSNERDENGRFAPGWKGGPGRPPRAVEADYLQAISDVCTPAAWRSIVERAVNDAKSGNWQARAWLAKYLVGEAPAVSIEHRGVNIYVPDNGRFNELPEGLREIEDDDFFGNAERLKAVDSQAAGES